MLFGMHNDVCHDIWHYRCANNLCVVCGRNFEDKNKFHHIRCERQGYPLHYVTHG